MKQAGLYAWPCARAKPSCSCSTLTLPYTIHGVKNYKEGFLWIPLAHFYKAAGKILFKWFPISILICFTWIQMLCCFMCIESTSQLLKVYLHFMIWMCVYLQLRAGGLRLGKWHQNIYMNEWINWTVGFWWWHLHYRTPFCSGKVVYNSYMLHMQNPSSEKLLFRTTVHKRPQVTTGLC